MSCFRSILTAKIFYENRTLTLNNLAEFPFVRFDDVRLNYFGGTDLIPNKCQTFTRQLQKLPRLNETNSICIWATVSEKRQRGYFIDHTQLLKHLRNKLLPICGYRQKFEYHIRLGSDDNPVENIITPILQMQQLIDCSNVAIDVMGAQPIRHGLSLIKTISSWMHRNQNTVKDGKEFSNQAQERVLEVEVACISDAADPLWNHFKKVLFRTFEAF